MGQLTSVCEISSQSGSGACGQGYASGNTGFLTGYTYNAAGQITGASHMLSNGSSNPGLALSASYSGNRISGQSYDADGNLESDPVAPATPVNAFDSEGHAVTYDALGRAVEAAPTSGTIEFLYGPTGGRLAVMNGQALEQARIGLPGGPSGGGAAVYGPTGLAYYQHADGLGSVRLASTPSRALYASTAYTPYGAAYDQPVGLPAMKSFTGQPQDIDSTYSGGQYDFPMREYNPIQGRWWTPVPGGIASVDPANPQSWDAYAYVSGTPLEATDPMGLLRNKNWPQPESL